MNELTTQGGFDQEDIISQEFKPGSVIINLTIKVTKNSIKNVMKSIQNNLQRNVLFCKKYNVKRCLQKQNQLKRKWIKFTRVR